MQVIYVKSGSSLKKIIKFLIYTITPRYRLFWCLGNAPGYVVCLYRYFLQRCHIPTNNMVILTQLGHPPELFMRRRHWKALMPLIESDYVGYTFPSWPKQIEEYIPRTLIREIKEKAYYLPIGFDAEFYVSDQYPQRQEKVIITMALWHLRKGLHKIIQAMKYLPEWKLFIAGSFKTENIPSDPYVAKQWNFNPQTTNREYRDYCLKIAQKHRSQIRFLGWLDKDGKKHWLHKASLFVLPTWTETQCIANLEAMACGCSVLITGEGGIPDYAPKQQWISRYISPEELAERIRNYDETWGLANQQIARGYDNKITNAIKKQFLKQVEFDIEDGKN